MNRAARLWAGALSLLWLAPGAPARAGADSSAPAVRLEWDVSSRTPYVGEEFTYALRLLSSGPLLRASLERPSFEGLRAAELGAGNVRSALRDGTRYSVREVRYRLTPSRSGPFTIGPARVTAELATEAPAGPDPTSGGDDPFFGRSFSRTVTAATAPLRLLAKPLPPYQGREPFSGLVGSYSLTAALETTRSARGEPSLLTVELRGPGDLADAPEPLHPEPAGCRLFPEPAEGRAGQTTGVGSGRKVFRTLVVPTAPGVARIGPFRLIVFDPGGRRYRAVEAGPVRLETGELGGRGETSAPGPPADLSLEVGPATLDPSGGGTAARLLWGLLLPPALAWFISSFVRHRRRTAAYRGGRRLASALLRQARTALREGAHDRALALLHRVLHLVLDAPSGAAARTGHALGRTAEEGARLLRLVEESRFSPKEGADARRAPLVAEAAGVERLARARWKERPRPPRHLFVAAAVLALCGTGVALGARHPAPVGPEVLAALSGAVEAYGRRDFGRAADGFAEVAQAGGRSGRLYHAAANAYLLSGEPARALLWYERAASLLPGDARLDALRRLAASRAGAVAAPTGAWRRLRGELSARRWAVRALALAASAVFWALVCIRWSRGDPRREGAVAPEVPDPSRREGPSRFLGGRTLIPVGLSASLLAGLALLEQGAPRPSRDAFVVAGEAVVRSGLTDETTELFRLAAGTRVRWDARRGDRIRVRAGGGRGGWASAAAVVPVVEAP